MRPASIHWRESSCEGAVSRHASYRPGRAPSSVDAGSAVAIMGSAAPMACGVSRGRMPCRHLAPAPGGGLAAVVDQRDRDCGCDEGQQPDRCGERRHGQGVGAGLRPSTLPIYPYERSEQRLSSAERVFRVGEMCGDEAGPAEAEEVWPRITEIPCRVTDWSCAPGKSRATCWAWILRAGGCWMSVGLVRAGGVAGAGDGEAVAGQGLGCCGGESVGGRAVVDHHGDPVPGDCRLRARRIGGCPGFRLRVAGVVSVDGTVLLQGRPQLVGIRLD